MKKPLIILLAIIVFLLPLMQIQQQTAQAAVTGKVVSLAAKKIAKEVATDAAIEVVGNLALNYALPDPDGKYKVDTGKQLICLPGGKKNGVCETPAQLDVTRSKVTIGNAVESELDKAINNGKHFTKWQKFLDWFAPLWAISFGVTFLTYVFDSDVRTMFNEIAMNALYSIGAIEPVIDNNAFSGYRPINDIPVDFVTESSTLYQYKRTISTDNSTINFESGQFNQDDLLTMRYYLPSQNQNYLHRRISFTYDGHLLFNKVDSTRSMTISRDKFETFILEIYDKQGNLLYTRQNSESSNNISIPIEYNNFIGTPIKITNLRQVADNHYQILMSGYYIWSFNYYNPTFQPRENPTVSIYSTSQLSGTQELHYSVNTDTSLSGTVPLPDIEHISPMVDPLEMTPYVDGSIMTMPSPSTIPFKHSETGEPLHRDEQDPNIWRDPVGEPVPEELIEVGDPGIIKQPDGSHIAVPQPTPSNPNPLPEPITQPKPEEPLTPDKFEDNSCDIIRKPKLDPLATAVTTSFPFSIPWDVKRIYDALFANVGSERPEFVFKIPGYDQEFDIKLNPYFDDWVPFIRTIILLTFDIGILYAAYRWTKGGGE